MTAKTILVQLLHKVETLEHIGKHIVLVLQDCLLGYLQKEFDFAHFTEARLGDPMHIHSYQLIQQESRFALELGSRISTDTAGVAKCLGIQAETKVDLQVIVSELEKKLSAATLLTLQSKPVPFSGALPSA